MKTPATHCKRSHPRTLENVTKNGTCKTCEKLRRPVVPPKTHCKNGHPKTPGITCKPCKREAKKRYLKAHPEVGRERKRKWRIKHPDKSRAQNAAWRAKNPEYGAIMVRKDSLKKLGWTPEMVKQTSLEQGGRCMICRQTPKPKKPQGGVGGLCADHKHTDPPQPRALLCHACNSGLGMFMDSSELCRAAADYLEAWA